MSWRHYSLTIGLPQTNYRQLAEARLLMEAGNFFWWALGEVIGRPVSQLRTAAGEPLYAVVYFVEETFPEDRLLSAFTLDDRLRFYVGLRATSSLGVEAHVVFDQEDHFTNGLSSEVLDSGQPPHPTIRFGSVFATPEHNGTQLRLAQPSNADLSLLEPITPEENPSRLTRIAQASGHLGLIGEDWPPLDVDGSTMATYSIDPDRDTNSTGLVYFANFVALLEIGERSAIPVRTRTGGTLDMGADLSGRHLLKRRIAYYVNAGLSDHVMIAVSRFAIPDHDDRVGLRYRLTRAKDSQLICLSEAVMKVSRFQRP